MIDKLMWFWHVRRLEIENARLEATAKQQNNRIEILQKEAQEATAVSTDYFITQIFIIIII